MKFIHTGDLHLGKRVHEQSMLEEQRAALEFIVSAAVSRHADAVVISGDIYDRSVPPAEAVELFDDFMTGLESAGIAVIAIPGNHDSAERVGYGGRILGKHNVHVAGCYEGSVPCVRVGDADFYMLPFIRPADVAHVTGNTYASYDECVRAALSGIVPRGRFSVLVAHQFVTAGGALPERSDSETRTLGGMDNVDVSAFDAFDYVALGHIHGAQRIGRDTARYAGSPLRYSFSECRHTKSVTLVETDEGTAKITSIPVPAIRQLYEVECALSELPAQTDKYPADSYMHITLTDGGEILNAIDRVREVFPNTLLLDFTRTSGEITPVAEVENKSTEQLFSDFYEMQTGARMTEEQLELLRCVSEVKDETD